MKTIEELKQFRGMQIAELTELVRSSEQELMNLRFRHSSGQLQKTSSLTAGRRKIARAKTVLAEKLQAAAK